MKGLTKIIVRSRKGSTPLNIQAANPNSLEGLEIRQYRPSPKNLGVNGPLEIILIRSPGEARALANFLVEWADEREK